MSISFYLTIIIFLRLQDLGHTARLDKDFRFAHDLDHLPDVGARLLQKLQLLSQQPDCSIRGEKA